MGLQLLPLGRSTPAALDFMTMAVADYSDPLLQYGLVRVLEGRAERHA